MSFILTERDFEILDTLSIRVRLLSLQQTAATWWADTPTGRRNARRRMLKLEQAGMVRRLCVAARPLPPLEKANAIWRPRDPAPCFGAIAWQLQSRWTEQPRHATVYIATKRSANVCGGRRRGELTHEFQATHDLAVAELYLTLKKKDPKRANLWYGEDMLERKLRTKLPDAVLAESRTARPKLVIEFGGAYDASRVRGFHRHCKKSKLPYEIW